MRRVKVRDVHETLNSSLSSDGSNSLCTLRVDVIEAEVPAWRVMRDWQGLGWMREEHTYFVS